MLLIEIGAGSGRNGLSQGRLLTGDRGVSTERPRRPGSPPRQPESDPLVDHYALMNLASFSDASVAIMAPAVNIQLSKALLLVALLLMALALGLMAGYLQINPADGLTALSAIAAAVSAVAAWQAVVEMKRDRAERNQPVVLIEFSAKHNGAIYCVVRNLGTGLAKDVAFKFDPIPIDYHGRPITSLPFFQLPIPVLGIGSEFRAFFHSGVYLYQRDIPRAFTAVVSYTAEDGERYTRSYEFNFDQLIGTAYPPKGVEDHLNELVDEMGKIRKLIERIVPDRSLVVESYEQHNLRMQVEYQEAVERLEAASEQTSESDRVISGDTAPSPETD